MSEIHLPVEIWQSIITDDELGCCDLAPLARTCRFMYELVTPQLYRINIEHEHSSVMWRAAHSGSFQALRKALDCGANPNAVGPGRLESSSEYHARELYKFSHTEEMEYGTALHYAARAGRNDIVALLVESGAKLDMPSRNVCRCVEHSNLGYVEESGGPPRWWPLHHAICFGHDSTATSLLDQGAPLLMCYDPIDEDDPGFPTIAHCAAAKGMDKLVQRA